MEHGLHQIQEMERERLHSQLVEERIMQRLHEREERKRRNEQEVAQLEIAVRLGEIPAGAPPLLVRRAQAATRRVRPNLTKADHREILHLYVDNSQRQVAQIMGVSKSTVGRHLRNPTAVRVHKGRQQVLSDEMVSAAARFMFLFKQATWQRCTVFLRKAFNVKVSLSTVRTRVKGKCGFRCGDFRRFPRDRNSAEAIQMRYEYATKGEKTHRERALYEAIYYDEMYVTKNTKTGAWTVVGWTPTVVEESPHENNGIHLSLLMAASPALGIIHWEILERSVTGSDVLLFFKAMVTRYVNKWSTAERKTHRPLIMDSVRTQHNKELVAYLTGGIVSQLVTVEYLPPYSPFLNPLEEVLGHVKRLLWERRAEVTKTSGDRHFLKKRLTDVVLTLDANTIKTFYSRVVEFLKCARDQTPVSIEQLYESSHIGDDETEDCPLLPQSVEDLLNSYLPHVYEEFTAQQQALVESQYGTKRLTLQFVEDLILPTASLACENEVHTLEIA